MCEFDGVWGDFGVCIIILIFSHPCIYNRLEQVVLYPIVVYCCSHSVLCYPLHVNDMQNTVKTKREKGKNQIQLTSQSKCKSSMCGVLFKLQEGLICWFDGQNKWDCEQLKKSI